MRRFLIVLVTAAVLAASCAVGDDSAGDGPVSTAGSGSDTSAVIQPEDDETSTTATDPGEADTDTHTDGDGDGDGDGDERVDPAGEGDAETGADESADGGNETDGAAGEVDTETCLVHEGSDRCAEILVPAGLSEPAPLVLDFHGWTGSAAAQRAVSGFASLARSEGFVVAWPDGYRASWNSGTLCCPPASSEDLDDVAYVRRLVDVIDESYGIDLDRVYLTGLSNGCALAQRVAVDASDLVAAVACMSLYLLDEPDAGYMPVPVMELHGTADQVVPYEPGVLFGGAVRNFEAWAERNGCSGDPVETWRSGESFALTFQSCGDGVEVAAVTIEGGGHVLYDRIGTDVDTTGLAWEFMSRFRRAG